LRKFAPLILLACLLTAGCWQTLTQPYRNVTSLQPFAAGTVTDSGPDQKVTHYTLKKIARGRYRMTQTDRGNDFGQGFDLGFFPLPGAPSHVLVYEAAALEFVPIAKRMRAPPAPPARAWARTAPARLRIAPRWKNRCWHCGRAARSRNTLIC
jgi:hypothetical protein